jgi:hypothetical protein
MPPSVLAQQPPPQLSPATRPVTSFDNSSQSSTTSQQSLLAPVQISAEEKQNITATVDLPELTPPSSAAESRDETPDSPTPRKTAIGAVDGPIHSPARSRSSSSAAQSTNQAGSKRTASGQIKTRQSEDQGRTPRPHIDTNHTRSSSTASVGSTGNVAEVC